MKLNITNGNYLKKIIIVICIVLVCLLVFKNVLFRPNSETNIKNNFLPTEEWVYTHVKRGMTKKQVIEAVGEPFMKQKIDEHAEDFIYDFLIVHPPKGRAYFSGFQVFFKDDKVEVIYPVYGDVK